MQKLIKRYWAILFLLIANLSIVHWLAIRYMDSSDESFGWLAILFIIVKLKECKQQSCWRDGELILVAAILSFNAFIFINVPILAKAILACSGFSLLLSRLLFNRFFHLGTWGLCVLSLPISATLQFFLGFPLRLLSSQLSGVFLRLSGFDVEVAGGVIKFGEKLISVDAPCSGVKMLTVTALLVCLISVYKKLTNWQTTLLSLFALVILIFANSVRATWLFFTESGIALYDYKDVIHDTSGVIIFILIVSTLLLFHKFFLNKEHMKIEKETVTSAKTFSITIFIFSCLITLFANPQKVEQQDISMTVEFPTTWDGKKLQELPMTAKELSFLKRFPGKIAKFRDKENNSYIFRIVTEKTRRLHSASDCFKGLGYRITYKPLVKDKFGVWQSFEAEKGGERKLVKEIIIDEAGRSWSDVSKWYWSASTSKYWNNVVIVSPL